MTRKADLEVRAWRFSYNARGIIKMPNRLEARAIAVIMVHPWGIDDDYDRDRFGCHRFRQVRNRLGRVPAR